MKRLVSLALSAALALSLLAGCGNSTDPQTTGTAPAGGNEGPGEAKDTIVWAQSGDINSLDFHVGKQYLSYGVTCNIFDTLVSWDADNNVIPMLATEWEFLDEDSIQFKLREGVTFHDGEPFTAEDVKYTYERARDHTIVKNNFSWLESVDVVDDYTVVINTIGAYSPVLNALCSPLCGIMPKHLMEANENAMAEFPIGTGPYKFVERAEGEYIKMEANEDYWGGTPKTKYLEMRVVPETSQRSVLLETGEIDFAYDVLPSDVERLNGNENLQVLEDASFKTFYLRSTAPARTPLPSRMRGCEWPLSAPLTRIPCATRSCTATPSPSVRCWPPACSATVNRSRPIPMMWKGPRNCWRRRAMLTASA